MDISTDMRIKEIVELYPETFSVFYANGFKADTKDELLYVVGDTLMLKTALKAKGLNQDLFLRQLEEKINEKEEFIQDQNDAAFQKVNFIGYTYCPLKLTFKEYFEEVLKKYEKETGDKDFKYYVPSGCVSGDPYDDLWKVDDVDQLPDIIASVGFGDYFRKEFVERFISAGYFEAVELQGIHREFTDAGLVDPEGRYNIYSVFPLVMLVDKKKLGKLPVPKQWSDLLNPIYSNKIIIGSSHGDFHEDLFIYILKEHGEDGLIKLSENIKTGWHASQMAKVAGTNSSEGAAIYVIPWMFAKSCPRTDNTEIIWPLDGALVTPNYFLVKESAIEKYKVFIEFLTGTDYGQKSADNYFPVINSKVDNKLPEGVAFKWIGWDYIRSHSMNEHIEYVKNVFMQAWELKQNSKEVIL